MESSDRESGAISVQEEDERALARAGAVVLDSSRTIAFVVLVAAVTAAAVHLALPDRYTARSVLYQSPTQSGNRLDMLSGQLPTALLGLSLGGQDSRMIQAIVESRTIRDSLTARFGTLGRRQVSVRVEQEGAVVVEVNDRDPERAAAIANAYSPLLNRLALQVSRQANDRKLAFLDIQLAQAQTELAEAEARLVDFQRRNGAPDVVEQGRMTMQAVLELQQRVTEKEIEVSQLRRVVTPGNPLLIAAESELNAWRAQLRALSGSGQPGNLLLSLEESPELRAEAYRLAREYQSREQVVLSLTASMAQAQLDTRNDLPVVSVIDPAVPPAWPTGPGLPLTVAVAMVLGLIAGLVYVLTADSWRRTLHNPKNREWAEAWARFRSQFAPRRRTAGRDTAHPISEGAADQPSPALRTRGEQTIA